MLFNSYAFLYFFLPVVLAGYYMLGRRVGLTAAMVWVLVVSLLFYAWGEPYFTAVLIASFTVNFFVGQSIMRTARNKKPILIGAIIFNLGLLAFFKYAYFFTDIFNMLSAKNLTLPFRIVLPLGISFYTFHQIRWLVDLYRGATTEYSFVRYALFVSFFPQLIAGPIVNHRDMMPQFDNPAIFSNLSKNLALGITIFIIGLFKKVILADGMAAYATPIFNAADAGHGVHLLEAWVGAAAYTFQLYFDFSGYSDMAVGLGYMFGIKLPVNFLSPYKTTNIREFWQRWHITLTRFLRDYVYIPLGGNRAGALRQYRNLFITMFLCGLWHGAGWTFVLWGCLHGALMIIYNIWAKLTPWAVKDRPAYKAAAHLLTILVVLLGWVIFRAETFGGAREMYEGMLGMNGVILPGQLAFLGQWLPVQFSDTKLFWMAGEFSEEWAMVFIVVCYLICIAMPNIYDALAKIESMPATIKTPYFMGVFVKYREGFAAALLACMLCYSVSRFGEYSEFIYFRF